MVRKQLDTDARNHTFLGSRSGNLSLDQSLGLPPGNRTFRKWLSFVAAMGLVACGQPGTTSDPAAGVGSGVLAGSDDASGAPGMIQAAPEQATAVLANARAVQITDASQLIGGQAAQGRVGDYLISNSLIRAIIQKPGREAGPGPYGGSILDMDIVRPTGEAGRDYVGEISPFMNLALTAEMSSVSILDDGATSGIAKIKACGVDNLYDFVDFSAVLGDEFYMQLLVPYDFNALLGLQICTTWSLGSSDSYIRMQTTFTNTTNSSIQLPLGDVIDAGGDVEAFVPNKEGDTWTSKDYTYGGFGSPTYAMMEYVAFVGDGMTYAYVPPIASDGSASSCVAGAAGIYMTVLGTTKIVKVLRSKDRYLSEIPARSSITLSRDVVVGPTLSAVTDTIYGIRKTSTGKVSGVVREETSNKVLAGVRVTVLGNSDLKAPITQFYTDAQGKFSGNLPAGSYGLIAAEGFDFMSDGRPQLQTPVAITVTAGGTVTKDLTLKATGKVRLQIFDGTNKANTPMPARVLFFGTDSTPAISALMDVKDDHVGTAGLTKLVFVSTGDAEVQVEPGTYDVAFTRGFEYDVQVVKGLVVTANQTATAKATLTRVIDTTGYLSADVHVHGVNSPDSPVSHPRRVASYATEGVEVLVTTDHDFVTDIRPTIDSMNLGNFMTTLVGEEITTFSVGHFNVFPLAFDAESTTGGAVNWMDATSNCLPFSVSSAIFDNLTVPQLFDVAEACNSAGSVMAKQVNHPRGSFQGYFSRLYLDLNVLGTDGETSADPASFRMPEGSDLFDPGSFNLIEVANADSVARAATNMSDWFGLLHMGYKMAGTAVSDTHQEVLLPAGYGRSWIRASTDAPGTAHNDGAFPQALTQNLVDGKATSGIGAFITAKVSNSSGVVAEMGGTVSAVAGKATLSVKIQNAAWVNYRRVDIFVNPIVYGNPDDVTLTNFASLGPAYTWCNTAMDVDGACRNLPTYTGSFTPSNVVVNSTNATASRAEGTITTPLTLSQDAWVVVVAWDGTTRPYTNYGVNTLAFSNPVYVDGNGDGKYTAPCTGYAVGKCPFVLPASQRPGSIVLQEVVADHHLEEYQTLSELMRHDWYGPVEVR